MSDANSPEIFQGLNIGQLLDEYSSTISKIQESETETKKHKQSQRELQQEIMRRCEEQGVDRLVGKNISVSVVEKPVVKVEGDWESVVQQLHDAGCSFLIQRRITASKLQEEMDNGLRRPDGVSIESVRSVSHRRSS